MSKKMRTPKPRNIMNAGLMKAFSPAFHMIEHFFRSLQPNPCCSEICSICLREIHWKTGMPGKGFLNGNPQGNLAADLFQILLMRGE